MIWSVNWWEEGYRSPFNGLALIEIWVQQTFFWHISRKMLFFFWRISRKMLFFLALLLNSKIHYLLLVLINYRF